MYIYMKAKYIGSACTRHYTLLDKHCYQIKDDACP